MSDDIPVCFFLSSGRAMKAKDVLYHEEGCFVCNECGEDLKSVSTYSKERADGSKTAAKTFF
jgi:hypothetical protein